MATRDWCSTAVAVSADERYIPGLFVSLASVLIGARSSACFSVVVVDAGLSEATIDALRALVAKATSASAIRVIPMSSLDCRLKEGLSPAVYGRLQLADACPDINRVLYLDTDVLVKGDVVDAFECDLYGAPLAAARDTGAWDFGARRAFGDLAPEIPETQPYYNSGVLLMDLDAWRRNGLGQVLVDCAAEAKGEFRFHDQDALNVTLARETAELAPCWNYQLRSMRGTAGQSSQGIEIVHFNDLVKPWDTLEWLRQDPVSLRAGLEWWRLALLSPVLPMRFRWQMARRLVALLAPFVRKRLGRS